MQTHEFRLFWKWNGPRDGYFNLWFTERKARQDWLCRICDETIHRGDKHASRPYDHVCQACVERCIQ